MAGKPEKMIKHLRLCANVSDEDQSWARQQLTASEQRSKENTPTAIHAAEPTPADSSYAKQARLHASTSGDRTVAVQDMVAA